MPPTQHMYRYLADGLNTETHWGLEFIYKFWQIKIFRAILQTRSFDLFRNAYIICICKIQNQFGITVILGIEEEL